MNTELTDEQLNEVWNEVLRLEWRNKSEGEWHFARAVIAADRERQDAIHREELAAYELTVANLREDQGRDKHWHDTAWNRGHQMGMAANRDIARQATEALAKEREAHAETNRMMTEALTQAEAAQGVPDGFTLVRTDTLAGWKAQVNTLAVLSGQDRRERTIKLKQEIADVLAAAPQPAAQPEPKPTSVSLSKRTQLEADGYVVNGVAMMHPETRRRVLLDYCGFVGWYGPIPEDAP